MTKTTRNDRSSEPSCRLLPSMPEAFDDLRMSVDRFCLLAGLESLNEMMSADAEALCGSRHARSGERKGHRWGTTRSEIAYHGGKVKVERPRVRDFAGREMSLPSWELLSEPELLQAWAMNLMVINVSTRKYARAVRLPDDAGGDLPAASGDATSKSAVSRRFVALTRSKLKAWLASPLDDLDLVVLQIDGLHVGDHLMVAAIGIDTGGAKHVLGLAEGATENAATVQAMLDNLIERGLDPERPRLYIVDGAKALSKAIRRTFGRAAALQRCQVHKGRNITDRLDESLHAGVRKVLRQAWQQDDAAKAERLLRNLARRLEHDAPGVSGSILEGLDEILTVIRLGLNNAQLIGRLGADATISHLTNGGRVANISIATDESFLDKNSGDKVDRTEWHRIVTFQDGLVEMMEKHAKKGRLVYVSGKLQTRKWRKDGEDSDRFSTEILLVPGGRVQFLDKPNGNGAPAMNADSVPSAQTAATVDDNEIPF